jgi:F420-dependent oxidoreductase-like protein
MCNDAAMKLSTQVSYAGGFKQAAQQVADLEKAGLDIVWVAEAYGYDAPSMMGYLAAVTDRVQIGAGIVNIYSRTPALLAMTAAGIDYLSDGRCIWGIGASGPQVIEGFHAVPYDKPVQRTREIIDICRRVWRREVLTNDGVFKIPLPEGEGTGLGKPLKLITKPARADIPLWVASLGEKNVEMTAEVADGWLPILFIPEKAQTVWGDALAKGKANRSSDLGPLEVSAGGMLAVVDDEDQAAKIRDFSRPMVALYVGGMGARGKNFYNTLARRYGFDKEATTIQNLYLDGKKDDAAAAVPPAFLEGTNLVGSEGYIKDRIAAFKEAGVTTLSFTPVGGDPVKLTEQLRGWVDDA